MSRNNTNKFITLVDNVLLNEATFFNELKEEKERIKSYPHLQKKYLNTIISHMKQVEIIQKTYSKSILKNIY